MYLGRTTTVGLSILRVQRMEGLSAVLTTPPLPAQLLEKLLVVVVVVDLGRL